MRSLVVICVSQPAFRLPSSLLGRSIQVDVDPVPEMTKASIPGTPDSNNSPGPSNLRRKADEELHPGRSSKKARTRVRFVHFLTMLRITHIFK